MGTTPKQLHHILRLRDFIEKYVKNKPYVECIKVDNREHLINVKRGDVYSLEEARVIAKQTCDETYEIAKDYQSKNEKFIYTEVDNLFEKVMTDIFKLHFREELLKN